FFAALDDLERERGVNKELIVAALGTALTSAYKKNNGEATNVLVRLNPEKFTIKIYSYKTVVADVVDIDKELTLEEGRAIKKSCRIGDDILTEIVPKDFGRIAAQTAKQVIMQAIREAERSMTYNQFVERENELLVGMVSRLNPEDGSVYVEIGRNQLEGVLLQADQNVNERYKVGDRIKVIIKRVKESPKGVQVMLSRSCPGLVKKLFEIEVPEIRMGIVTIKNIVREAGYRTKMAVESNDADIDPVGSCVGNRGARVNAIINELNGEKIDIIAYSDDILDYIARALSPAKVLMVQANEDTKESKIIVPDDKLSLAIGKDGQNARLAARLTGWKIDVRSYTSAVAEGLLGENSEVHELVDNPIVMHKDFENTEITGVYVEDDET
ncbi:MAG: transcription termination factor NusA, partial [Clostridia bacterium]